MVDKAALKAGGGMGALAIGLLLVTNFEGTVLQAYYDPVGIPTICSGVTSGVKIGDIATPAECDARTRAALQQALVYVDALADVDMPETRRAALASFVFNVGPGNFKRSTLLRKLNAGDTIGACNEMQRWIYAGKTVLRGLVKRRAAEREICLMDSMPAVPAREGI